MSREILIAGGLSALVSWGILAPWIAYQWGKIVGFRDCRKIFADAGMLP